MPVMVSDGAVSTCEPVSRSVSLAKYLAKHGLVAQYAPQPTRADAPLFSLARRIARDLPALRPLLAILRRTLSSAALHRSARCRLTKEEAQASRRLAEQLRPYDVHIRIRETSNGVSITCRVPRTGPIRQFLTGLWLEFYAYEVVLQALLDAALPGMVYRSVAISRPGCGQQIGELDVVAIWDRGVLVVETKTGGGKPRSFRLLKKLLNVRRSCAVLVRTGGSGICPCETYVRCGVASLEAYVRQLLTEEATARERNSWSQVAHASVHAR